MNTSGEELLQEDFTDRVMSDELVLDVIKIHGESIKSQLTPLRIGNPDINHTERVMSDELVLDVIKNFGEVFIKPQLTLREQGLYGYLERPKQ